MKHRTSPWPLTALLIGLALPTPADSQALRSAGSKDAHLRLRNFPATSAASTAAGGRRFFVHATATAELDTNGSVKVLITKLGGDSAVDLGAAGCAYSNVAERKAKTDELVTSELSCEIEVTSSVHIAAQATASKGTIIRVTLEATPVLE